MGEKCKQSVSNVQEATAALKDATAAAKAAKDSKAGFEKDMSTAGARLEKAKEELTAFEEGALKSFADLRDLAPPPEPEPSETEVAEAAQEPAVASEAATHRINRGFVTFGELAGGVCRQVLGCQDTAAGRSSAKLRG